MAQLTPLGLVRILGHVSAIMVIPMVGGAVLGLLLDRNQGTSPLFVFSGFAIGNVIAIAGLWLYVRWHTARGFGRKGEGNGS